MTIMAGEWSSAIILFGAGNEKSTGCIPAKSCGHTIYWGLGGRYETGDISNIYLRIVDLQNLRYLNFPC
jgi:hypothetical protein